MRRKYNAGTIIEHIFYAKQKIKDLNITADIIVGFPGETDEDFEKSVDIVKILNIYHAHIFTYSKRPGTNAADFPNQIDENVKNIRSKKLFEVCGKIKEEIHQNCVNKEFDVIIEKNIQNGLYAAKTKNFIDTKIKIKAGNTGINLDLHGTVQTIKIVNYDKDFIYGEILK
jgi:threonylcarbamoyladenosine tRNA methylthiotransferase MtaB